MFFQDLIRNLAIKSAQKAEMKAAEGELRAAARKLMASPEFNVHVASLHSMFQPKFGRTYNDLNVFLVGSADKNALADLNAFKEVVTDLAKGRKRISPQLLSHGHINPNMSKTVASIGVSPEAALKQVFPIGTKEPIIVDALRQSVNNTQGGMEFVNKEIAEKRANGILANDLPVKDVVFPPEWNEANFNAAHEHINAIASHIKNAGLIKARDAYLAVNEAHAAAGKTMLFSKTTAPIKAVALVQTPTRHSRVGPSTTAEIETGLL